MSLGARWNIEIEVADDRHFFKVGRRNFPRRHVPMPFLHSQILGRAFNSTVQYTVL